jgi:DNA anti-recombination protein RmuC
MKGATMTITEPVLYAEDKSSEREASGYRKLARVGPALQQTNSGNGDADGDLSAENLNNLLRRLSKTSIGEIDNLITELQTLRRKLSTDGERIQSDIAKHAELSQQVMQLAAIITDSVKKLPGASAISH